MREVDLIGRIETPITLKARLNANAVSTTNYNELGNKPKINGVTLYGDLTPEELGIFYGAPFVANTVAEMTNTDKVYVYTGSETGYVAGNWYYYNGSTWVSGGVYNSAAVQTDRTLTQEDKAADAKAVGDALAMKAGIIEDTVTGEIVSFVPDKTIDKLLDASLEMSPIQSLNGYDSPWPAGGGTNKWDEQWEVGGISNQDGTEYNNSSTFRSKNYTPVIPNTTYYFRCGTADIIGLRYYDANKSFIFAPALNANRAFTTPADAAYLRFVDTSRNTYNNDISINYPSSVTTYSPYSNICPISGHTGADLIRTGKNLWEKESSYSLASSGTIISNATLDIPLKAGSYTLSMGGNISSAASFSFRRSDSTIIGAIQISSAQYDSGKGKYIRSFQLADDAYRINLYVSGAVDINEIQLESGDSATAYETNKGGNAYSASFASASTVYRGTVYGGSYDFMSGALKENVYHDRLLSTAAWYMQAVGGHNYFCTTAFKNALTTYHNLVACTHFGVGGNASALDDPGDCTITNAYGRYYPLNIRCDAIASVEDFKTFLANNEVYVSIEVAPREYTLSPQQLTTLQGQNVMWGNGTATIKYAADAKTYIDNKIAAAVAALS